jgi:hypothetical protein
MNPKRKINEKAVKAKESDINIRLNGTCSDMTPIYGGRSSSNSASKTNDDIP